MKRLTSATAKENVRRQVERKRRFEMSMPQGGTNELERAFETSPYVGAVYTAFKEGDDEDAVYAMRGILLLALQFRNGTRCGEFRNLTVSTHLHTHTHAHTHARTHTRTQILQILYLISFQFAQVRHPKNMPKVTTGNVTVVLEDHKTAGGYAAALHMARDTYWYTRFCKKVSIC